jgi:hypothetical protein
MSYVNNWGISSEKTRVVSLSFRVKLISLMQNNANLAVFKPLVWGDLMFDFTMYYTNEKVMILALSQYIFQHIVWHSRYWNLRLNLPQVRQFHIRFIQWDRQSVIFTHSSTDKKSLSSASMETVNPCIAFIAIMRCLKHCVAGCHLFRTMYNTHHVVFLCWSEKMWFSLYFCQRDQRSILNDRAIGVWAIQGRTIYIMKDFFWDLAMCSSEGRYSSNPSLNKQSLTVYKVFT